RAIETRAFVLECSSRHRTIVRTLGAAGDASEVKRCLIDSVKASGLNKELEPMGMNQSLIVLALAFVTVVLDGQTTLPAPKGGFSIGFCGIPTLPPNSTSSPRKRRPPLFTNWE